MQRMPQLGQQGMFGGMRPPMGGLFGGMQQFQQRRPNMQAGQMPRLDPAMFMQALQNRPGFGSPQPPPMSSLPSQANPQVQLGAFAGTPLGAKIAENPMLQGLFAPQMPGWGGNFGGE